MGGMVICDICDRPFFNETELKKHKNAEHQRRLEDWW